MVITDTIFSYSQEEQKALAEKIRDATERLSEIEVVLFAQPSVLKEFENASLAIPFFVDQQRRALKLITVSASLEEIIDEFFYVIEEFMERIDSNPYKVVTNNKLHKHATDVLNTIKIGLGMLGEQV